MSSTIKQAILSLKSRIADAYTAIAAKGGTLPATQDSANLPTAIASIPSGGGDPQPQAFNFVDFNGLQQSYTKEEIDAMTELPSPKSYNGLTFDGWSRTLAELKTLTCCTIGGWYKTSDGKVRVVVYVDAAGVISVTTRQRTSYIDWGDGDTTTSIGYSNSHTYSEAGVYKIVMDGTTEFYVTPVSAIKEVYFSGNELFSSVQAFRGAERLEKLCIPKESAVPIYDAYYLTGTVLSSIVAPSTATSGTWNTYQMGVSQSVKYIVADGLEQMSAQLRLCGLISFSLKSATSYTIMSKDRPFMTSLLYLKLEEGVTGWPDWIYVYSYLRILDLPSTITAISTSIGVTEALYIRTANPPTYAYQWNRILSIGIDAKIHVRADASYTDGDNVTWYGIEAYEHATNWSGFAGKYIADL